MSFYKALLVVLLSLFSIGVCACGEQAGEQPQEMDQDTVTAEIAPGVWMGDSEARATSVAGMNGEWLVACTCTEPRGYGFGQIFKVSSDLEILWSADFYGRDLELLDIIALSDGNFLIAGSDSPTWDDEQEAEMMGYEVVSDYWVCKVDPEGNVLWERSFSTGNYDYSCSALECENGDLAIAGSSMEPGGSFMYRLLRADPEGNIIWDNTYGLPEGQLCDDAIITEDGSFLLAGTRTDAEDGETLLLFIKVDPEGNEIWSSTHGRNESDYLYAVTGDQDGGLVAVGRTTGEEGQAQAFIIRLGADGEELWSEYYDYDGFNDVSLLDNGEYLVCGGESIVRIDALGEVLWEVSAPDTGVMYASRALQMDESHVLFLGFGYPTDESGITSEWYQAYLALLSI